MNDVLIVELLTGKKAIVTGASKGIGRALAVGLANAGADVVVNYKNDSAGAESTCAEIAEAGGSARMLQADISTVEGAEMLVKESASLLVG